MKGKSHSEDLGVDGKTILKISYGSRDGRRRLERVQCRVLVNTLSIQREIIIYLCCLFNDVISTWDCVASDGEMTDEQRIGKDMERKGTRIMSGTIPPYVWKNWQKPRKTTVNTGAAIYEARLPTTWRSARINMNTKNVFTSYKRTDNTRA